MEAGTCIAFSSLTDKGSDWTAASCMSLTSGGTTIGTGTCKKKKQEKKNRQIDKNLKQVHYCVPTKFQEEVKHTGTGIVTGTGVCWEYMFIGTGMKTGTGTGTTTTLTFSSPSAELPEGRDNAARGETHRSTCGQGLNTKELKDTYSSIYN